MHLKVNFLFTEEKIVVGDIFASSDTSKDGTVSVDHFIKIITQHKLLLDSSEQDIVLKRYQVSKGDFERVDYRTFELDLVDLNADYETIASSTAKVDEPETPEVYLSQFANFVTSNYRGYEHLCKELDTSSKGYLNAKDLNQIFTKACTNLTQQSFVHVLTRLDPKRSRKIYYHQFTEMIKPYITPVTVEVNYFG